MIGNGNGTFQPFQTFATGTRPISVAASDLNGDDTFDLVTSNTSANNLSVLVANGPSSFQPQFTMSGGQAVQSLAVADVNGDGRLDLAVANLGNVTVLAALSGTFFGQTYTITGDTVTAINRLSPSGSSTGLSAVSFSVAFSESVTGVDATDFQIATTQSVVVAGPITVSGGGTSYTVTVNGIRGTGDLQLNLVDDNSIVGASGHLGGPGVGDGSFAGKSYLMLGAFPRLLSVLRTTPAGPSTSSSSVSYTVSFNKAVVCVDPSDY